MKTVREKEEEIQAQAKGLTAEQLAKIRQRARELAMNQGRPADTPSEQDWQQAQREFLNLQTTGTWDESVARASEKAEIGAHRA